MAYGLAFNGNRSAGTLVLKYRTFGYPGISKFNGGDVDFSNPKVSFLEVFTSNIEVFKVFCRRIVSRIFKVEKFCICMF